MSVLTLLREIPAAVWGTIVGAFLSLAGVMLSHRHARKLQAAQLKHDSEERSRERQMSWRREVYLSAAESVSRLSGLIGRIPDLGVPDQELSRVFQDDIAKITRIQVIASDKTVRAINVYSCEFSTAYLQLSVERGLLTAQRNEIELLGASIKTVEQGQERDGAQADTRRKQLELLSQRRQSLTDQLPKAQLDLLKRCFETGFRLAPLITPLLISVREELDLPLDSEEYIRHSNEITEKLRCSINASMQKVDDFLAGGDPREKEHARGVGEKSGP